MYNRRSSLGRMPGRSLAMREAYLPGLVRPQGRPEKNDFLIDTLPIRIVSKPFNCIAGVHSNRHSSEASNLNQNWAGRRRKICRFEGGVGKLLNHFAPHGVT